MSLEIVPALGAIKRLDKTDALAIPLDHGLVAVATVTSSLGGRYLRKRPDAVVRPFRYLRDLLDQKCLIAVRQITVPKLPIRHILWQSGAKQRIKTCRFIFRFSYAPLQAAVVTLS